MTAEPPSRPDMEITISNWLDEELTWTENNDDKLSSRICWATELHEEDYYVFQHNG